MPRGPVFRRRHPRVLLEVAAEEGLVREVQAEGNLLHGEVRGAQQHLDFLDAAGVYQFLGRVARQVLEDGGEVAGGDAQLVGISPPALRPKPGRAGTG